MNIKVRVPVMPLPKSQQSIAENKEVLSDLSANEIFVKLADGRIVRPGDNITYHRTMLTSSWTGKKVTETEIINRDRITVKLESANTGIIDPTTVVVNNALFTAYVTQQLGTYMFKYKADGWNIVNGETETYISLISIGITVTGTPAIDDVFYVEYDKKYVIASSTDSELVVAVDIDTFVEQVGFEETGEYTFRYIETGVPATTGWYYGVDKVNIADYGITVTGTPYAGDTINAVYTNTDETRRYTHYEPPFTQEVANANVTSTDSLELSLDISAVSSNVNAASLQAMYNNIYAIESLNGKYKLTASSPTGDNLPIKVAIIKK